MRKHFRLHRIYGGDEIAGTVFCPAHQKQHDLVKAIELVTLHAGFSGECINVANGREITLREAAETFVRELGEGHHVEFNNETRPGDPLNWCADISILKTFGYNCHYDLQQGLKNYIQWLREEKL